MVGSCIINKCIEENQLPVDFPADDIESNMNPSGFVYNESESSQNCNVESPKEEKSGNPDTFQEVEVYYDNEYGGIETQATFKSITNPKIQISWKNVTVTKIEKNRCCSKKVFDTEPMKILDDCSGTVTPGIFLAIIGASGAGKTTLLNFLCNKDQRRNLNKQGEVFINGVNRDKIDFKRFIGYVQQNDVLYQSMKVRECLMFAAQLKLPPTEDHSQLVDSLIESLKLQNVAEMKIGGSFIKGISGGERKRTCIGVELITDPSLIFLDEPITGLDSFTATTIVEMMSGLCIAGRTIISTVHQPSLEIFSMFDQLMLMAHGKTIYFNKASLAVNYFTKIGYPCPSFSNPIDYFVEIMSKEAIEAESTNDSSVDVNQNIEDFYQKKIAMLSDFYEKSELKCNPDYEDPEAIKSELINNMTHYRAPFWKQFLILIIRSMKWNIRVPYTGYIQNINIICKLVNDIQK